MTGDPLVVVTLVCASCGYQWDENMYLSQSVFEMFCPVCDANMVHRYSSTKEDIMGEDYDGLPWF